jgi:uncharacterized protein
MSTHGRVWLGISFPFGKVAMLGMAAALALVPAGVVAREPLFEAAIAGEIAVVERLLAAGANIDGRDHDQATPLIAAALASQAAIVKVLIAHGANVQARNAGGFTALHAAAYSGSTPIVEFLLDSGANIDDADNRAGVTPLLVAAEENHQAVAELLLARGADLSVRERHGYTALSRALFKRHAGMLRLLKRHGATCEANVGGEAAYRLCLDIGN